MAEAAAITPEARVIPRAATPSKPNLIGLGREALRQALVAAGAPEKQSKMRTGQIWQWLYQKGVRDFAAMTNLSKVYRAELAERFVIEIPEMVTKQVSADGVLFYQILDAAQAAYEVRGLENALLNLTMTNIRSVMGSMDLDELLSQRDTINAKLLGIVDDATTPWGIKVTRIEMMEMGIWFWIKP